MKEIIIFDDIPENCPECIVNRLGTCTPEGRGSDSIVGRPDWCPRIPVPDAVVDVIREIGGRRSE